VFDPVFDFITSDLLSYVIGELEKTDFERDPILLCEKLEVQRHSGPRHIAYSGEVDIILVKTEEFGSRLLFDIAHELSHVLIKRGGYDAAIRHYHSSVPNMKQHMEELANYIAGVILMPPHDVYDSQRSTGDSPLTIMKLAELSGASANAAMRRWATQDLSGRRGAFITEGNYIQDMTTCNLWLPFQRFDRVPEIALHHPEVNVLSLGEDRLLGTVAW